MATYRHVVPGSILASRRLIVSDAVTSSSTTKFTIQQPANSIVDAVIVRALDKLVLDSSGDVGVKVGITEAGAEICAGGSDEDNILDGADTINSGAAYNLTILAAQKFNGPTRSVTTDERDLHFTVVSDTDVDTNGRLEFTVVYRIFD